MPSLIKMTHWIAGGCFLFLACTPLVWAVDEKQATQLEEQLAQWNQYENQKRDVSGKLQTLDLRNDPERDDRFWWNPFWRVTRETQAQKANDLTADLQRIEQDQQALEPELQTGSAAYAVQALATAAALSPAQLKLWEQADTWRIPRLLQAPNWEMYSSSQFNLLSSELKLKRLDQLRQKEITWKDLDNYLTVRQQQVSANPDLLKKYAAWQQQLKPLLISAAQLLDLGAGTSK